MYIPSGSLTLLSDLIQFVPSQVYTCPSTSEPVLTMSSDPMIIAWVCPHPVIQRVPHIVRKRLSIFKRVRPIYFLPEKRHKYLKKRSYKRDQPLHPQFSPTPNQVQGKSICHSHSTLWRSPTKGR